MKSVKSFITLIIILSAVASVLMACGGGGGGGGSGDGGGNVTLESITVVPANSVVSVGNTKQFTATGTYSDSSTQNITSSVIWSSSDISKASINSTGLVTAVAAGVTTIRATSGDISGTVTLTVTILPETGQTISYGTEDDGSLRKGLAWPSPRFTAGTVAESDCVTDNLTGLMWVKSPDSTTRTWANALIYANGLSLCGYDDWRLPNRKELRSLVNYGEATQATWLNNQGFSNVQTWYYWSSTTYANDTDNAWVVFMWYGYMQPGSKTTSIYVWPVRSGQ